MFGVGMVYEVYSIRWYFTACDLSTEQPQFETFSNLILFLNTIQVFPNLFVATHFWGGGEKISTSY